MEHCEFCKKELPANAQFCGKCGYKIDDIYVTVTDFDNPVATSDPTPQTPPIFSSPLHPDIQSSRMSWQDTDSSYQTRWDVEGMKYDNSQFTHGNTDENGAVLPDLLLPGILAMQNQMPSPAQAPMVQGTPQFGGVPSVQGSPVAPGNVPQSIPAAHGAASSVPSYAPQEAQPNPIQHQQVQHARYQPSSHYYQPVHQPQPNPLPNELEQKHHHRRHQTGPLHEHKPRSSRLHHPAAVTSKAGMSVVSKWLIITIAALVIIGSSSILLAHSLMPTTTQPALIITGSNAVKDGGALHVHGQGFQPGDGVTLTIDNGLPVSLAGQHGTQAVAQGTEKNEQVTGLSQMNIAGALQPHSADNSNITVSSTGTFDATITVPSGLQAGKHTIHATDNQRSVNASLQFTISSSQLAVNPTALNFGSVEVGRSVKLLVTLSNQGGASLQWTATIEGSNTNWLTLSKSSDVIGTSGSGEPIIVTANTNGLTVGSRTATLRFHSDNGDVQTTVKINVISIGQSGQQAILNVPQQSLDFGQLQAGQQAQQSISIANLGNLPLQWQASSDSASATWLSLATTKGTVQPGAVPQMVQVKVNTTGLAAGSYSGTIHITSNGGNTQVGVTLVVTGSTSTPTPSPSPSQSPSVAPTVTNVSPTSGASNGGTLVMITGTGFTSNTSVSFGQTPASNITRVSNTLIKATSPTGSGTVHVTVTTPGGTSATSSSDQFTYTVVSPSWSVSPTNLDASTCGQTAPCKVTLTEDAHSTGNIDWTVSSDVAATFDLANGTLKPGGQQQVSISGMTCKNGTITFSGSGGVSPLTVSWKCTIIQNPPTPMITVTPQKIDPTTCTPNSDGTYTCNVTVGETSPGDLTWFTTVSVGGTGTSISPQKGQLSASQTQQSVQIASIPCQNDSFSFIDQNNNTATVVWNCTPPTQKPLPVPTVTSISPASGSNTGGTPVTITGTGFIGATSVSFGQTPAKFSVTSDTQITVTSPAGTGTVHITVTTAGGTSATGTFDQFTYSSASIG